MSDILENCPECGNKSRCKKDCSSAESFSAFKKARVWLHKMTNKQLAVLHFEIFDEAHKRSEESN